MSLRATILAAALLSPSAVAHNAPPAEAIKYGGIVLTLTVVLDTHGYRVPESFRHLTRGALPVSYHVDMAGCEMARKGLEYRLQMKWWQLSGVSCRPLVEVRK